MQLQGHSLYLGRGGFSMVGSNGGLAIKGPGYISSLYGAINISFANAVLGFHSRIQDNGSTKVGLNITQAGNRGVVLAGGASNTFTGESYVSGNSILYLKKDSGVVSMSGNLTIKGNADVMSYNSGQFARHVRVTLKDSHGSTKPRLILYGVKESFHELVVENAEGILEFRTYNSTIIIDDLRVTEGSLLYIKSWGEKGDLFLVHKSSIHVKDSLKYISFDGRRGVANLKDYNKDYWRLSSIPEPSTYGALFSVLGLGVAAQRKCRKRQRVRSAQASA